jgi:hypothetical protein
VRFQGDVILDGADDALRHQCSAGVIEVIAVLAAGRLVAPTCEVRRDIPRRWCATGWRSRCHGSLRDVMATKYCRERRRTTTHPPLHRRAAMTD